MDTEMSHHRMLTLEKKILPPLLQGFKPMLFRSQVWHSNHWAIPTPPLIPCGKFGSLCLGKTTGRSLQEQHCPLLPVCAVFHCVQIMVWLIHAVALYQCLYTVRESALKVDSGRKIPCRLWESNLCQYCRWYFGLTLYQLNYPAPGNCNVI